MINFAICDDNKLLSSRLKEILESIFFKFNYDAKVEFCSDNAEEFLNYTLSHKELDVLFLDIDLNSDINGIDMAKIIRKNNKLIYFIFITGHFEYIVSAYDCKTFAYIQKPFSYKKIEETIVRLFEDITGDSLDFLAIDHSNKLIKENLVNYLQKEGTRTIYRTDSAVYNTYGSFNKIEQTLPNNFVRCHKSFIVNMKKINGVDFKSNTIFLGNNGKCECFIGPKYKKHFLEVLNNYEFFK